MNPIQAFLCLLTVVLYPASPLGAAESEQPCLQNGNVRLVLVGDSITGQSWNAPDGFAHRMEAALKAIYPDSKPDLIVLGGSGQSVESWQNVEKEARTAENYLDVKDIGVKATLDQPADVLVIMLGMNNVLAPYTDQTPASLDQWTRSYQELIDALRKRLKPRVIGLGSITPCTEELASPKNQLMDAMNERVRALAQKAGARYLPTSESVREILRRGRTLKPDFHVTRDFIHPNEAGHLGIAIGMLKGLGEARAAEWLVTQKLANIWKHAVGTKPSFSWQVMPTDSTGLSGRFTFHIKYWWPVADGVASPSPRVRLVAPAGWQFTPLQMDAATGEFTVTGLPDQARNILVLEGKTGDEERHASVVIPAPWLVAAKLVQPYWNGSEFDAEKGRTPVDDTIEKGGDFTGPLEVSGGQKLVWQLYFPSVNFTGLDDPASVDFAAVTHAATFEGGYGAHWIYSERDRPVRLEIGTQMFAGETHLIVWINNQELYRGKLANKRVETRLKKGWNTLAFKANHRTWQWQLSVGLAGVGDDSLADLRYSIKPPAAADKACGK